MIFVCRAHANTSVRHSRGLDSVRFVKPFGLLAREAFART